jgi:hypothetical protein
VLLPLVTAVLADLQQRQGQPENGADAGVPAPPGAAPPQRALRG